MKKTSIAITSLFLGINSLFAQQTNLVVQESLTVEGASGTPSEGQLVIEGNAGTNTGDAYLTLKDGNETGQGSIWSVGHKDNGESFIISTGLEVSDANQERLAVGPTGSLTVGGSDLVLGNNDGRSSGTNTGNRALVHAINDELMINYDGDFEGGVSVGGPGLFVVEDLQVRGHGPLNYHIGFAGASHPLWAFNYTGYNVERLSNGNWKCGTWSPQDGSIGGVLTYNAAGHFYIANIPSDAGNGTTGDFELTTEQLRQYINFKVGEDGVTYAKEIKVTLSGWPDYVFSSEHDLMPMDSVENFIEENHHLPGVPSAQEVEEEGLSIGEMQKIQMQKIEELTLYMIQLKKENQALKAKLEAMEEEKEQTKDSSNHTTTH